MPSRSLPEYCPARRYPSLAWVLLTGLLLSGCATAPEPEAETPTPPAQEPTLPAAPTDPFELLETPAEERGPGELVLVAVGDVAQPARQWPEITESLGDSVFDPTRELLASGDLVFMNLESPLTERPPVPDKRFAYTTPPERLAWYLDAGFNMISLANNHIADAGEAGIQDTVETIDSRARVRGETVFHAGAGRAGPARYEPVRIEPEGRDLTIAFFAAGFSDSPSVIHWSRDEGLFRAIRTAAESGDFDLIVVSAHAGIEYEHVPADSVRQAYRRYIVEGADLVLGHHPHVIQPVEHYGDGLIFYSLGNFVFASRTQRHHATDARLYGMMARIVIRDRRLKGAEIVPLWVNNSEGWTLADGSYLPRTEFTPKVLEAGFAREFFKDLEDWSRESGATVPETVNDRGRIRLD